MGTTYTKRTLTIEEQINVLKERGLQIDNIHKATEVLDVISYFRQQTLYPQLCCVVYWLNAIYPDNTLASDLKSLIRKYPSVNPRLMGFPESWEEEPLWKVASR